jgi:glycosyltransferase involved in cell wall biosynthesis
MNPAVVMLRGTMVDPEPRLEKVARFLVSYHWDVSVVAWDRTSTLPRVELRDGFIIYRIPIRANFGSGIPTLFPLLNWQWRLFDWLFTNRKHFQIIHAADFDTVIPACIISVLFKKRLIYDIYDFYVDSRLVPSALGRFVRDCEIWFMERADVVIVADESRMDQIQGGKPKRIECIYNTPDIKEIELPDQSSDAYAFRVAYVGILSLSRGLEELVNVVSHHSDWRLDLAGFGLDEPGLLTKINHADNIIFHGRISYSDAMDLYSRANVLVATYDPQIKNHRFSSPNKVFEAMALGKPIIVAKDTGVDKLVEQMSLGTVVEYGNLQSLEKALYDVSMWSSSTRRDFSHHLRMLYETHFSWNSMQTRLKSIYDDLQ